MGALRKQMDGDLVVRGMSVRTREAYLGAVAGLAKYYGRRPDGITEQEVQNYLLYLIEERKLAWSSCNIVAQGLKFFYRITLKRPEAQFAIPRARQAQKLPQILSREEIEGLIENTFNVKHRAILMTAYGAGLRLNEICHLKVSDIDSDRMAIRVEQGKGAKDRYTLLSPRGESRSQRTLFADLRKNRWVVYAKRPFAGPEQLLEYLGRYTHRAAISNERLVSFDECAVRFRYKDYAHGNQRKVLSPQPQEFLRRFVLHVLPRGFNRIRHYGLLANRNKRVLLACARTALEAPAPAPTREPAESTAAFWQRIAGINIERCPHCQHGMLRLVAQLAPRTHPPP